MKLKHRIGVWFIGVGAWLIEDMRKEIPKVQYNTSSSDAPTVPNTVDKRQRIVSKSGKPI